MGKEHPARRHYQMRLERRVQGSWGEAASEADATHAVILIRHREFTTELVFEMGGTERSRRDALYQRSQVERLIELAYERGDEDARADVRRALRIG